MGSLKVGCDGKDFSLLQDTEYRIFFPKIPVAEFFCQRIVIPDVVLGVAENSTPFLDMKNVGEKPTYGRLNAVVIVDKKMNNYVEIYNWMHNMSTMNQSIDGDSECVVVISNRAFKFKNVFPTSLGQLQFTSTAGESSPVTFDVEFSFDSMVIEMAG